MALSIRKDIITTSENTDRSFSHLITMLNIQSAVKKLRPWKSGGVSAVTSDCFIRGNDSLYAFIAMLLHWTLPNEFCVSILLPIPKESHVYGKPKTTVQLHIAAFLVKFWITLL